MSISLTFQRLEPPMEKAHQLFYTLLNQNEGAQFVVEQNEELVGFTTLYFTFDTLFAHCERSILIKAFPIAIQELKEEIYTYKYIICPKRSITNDSFGAFFIFTLFLVFLYF
jgi:hypothetical protein